MARYLFTSRFGGVSNSPYESLNLGDHVGDQESLVAENRNRIQEYLSLNGLVFMNQTHGTQIQEVNQPGDYEADALISRTKNLGIAVLTADCIPLLISGTNCVAAVHVGRKGFLAGIVEKSVRRVHEFGSEFQAIIGPAICGSCYEVSVDMYQSAVADFPALATSPEQHALDLPAAVIAELNTLDIPVTNTHRCTQENTDYYSYRRAPITGRMAGIISL